MARAEDIRDQQTLRAWLEGRPRRDAVIIAHRAALQVFPLWAAAMDEDWAQNGDWTALPILRCHLISAVAALVPTADIKGTARAASASASAAAYAANFAASARTAASASARASASASAASASANSAANASAARAAAANAAAASSFSAALWASVRSDALLMETDQSPMHETLWQDGPPDAFAHLESQMLAIWDAEPSARWDFWRRWWEGAKRGEYLDPQLQLAIVQGVDDEIWKAGPDAVAERIREIEAGIVPPLSDAAFTDFRFDEIHQWMTLADFDDDLAHLRDPAVITAFREDCEDLRDQLQDFVDYAGDALPAGSNAVSRMIRSADKLIVELDRADSAGRLRARRFVQLGQQAEISAAMEDERAKVGEENARQLDAALDAFRAICRKHMGPVLHRMEPLDGFELRDADPAELVDILSKVVDRLKAAKVQGLKPLDPNAQTLFDDLVDGLADLQSQLAEAQSPERKQYLATRFSRQFAGTVATAKKLTERMAPYAEGSTKQLDRAIKNHERWTKFSQALEWLMGLLP